VRVKINKYAVDEETKRKTLQRERQVVEVEVIKENMKTVWVKLPGGKVIKRKRRDIVSYSEAPKD
jgi:hypothetical protein